MPPVFVLQGNECRVVIGAMSAEHIDYDEAVRGHAVFTYRRWLPWLNWEALFWALVGGAAIAVAVGLASAVLGWIPHPAADSVPFQQVIGGSAALGTLLLYGVGYWLAARRSMIAIEFDAPTQRVYVWGTHIRGRQRYPLGDVGAFRLADARAGWRAVCVLVMETNSSGPVSLVVTPNACQDARAELPQLVAQLNAQLEALHPSQARIPPYWQPAMREDYESEANWDGVRVDTHDID